MALLLSQLTLYCFPYISAKICAMVLTFMNNLIIHGSQSYPLALWQKVSHHIPMKSKMILR